MTTAVVKNIISCLVFAFWIIDKFSLSTLHQILEQEKVKGSPSKANKDCQIRLDIHTKKVINSVHSRLRVLCRYRRRSRILKSLS